MIRNHIKIAWRNLLKNSTYSLINIIGLTIGLAACLAVTTVVIDESSYDRFFTKKDQIFRVNTINTRNGELLEKREFAPLGTNMALKDFPEVENIATIRQFDTYFSFRNIQGEGTETEVIETNPSFLDIFDVEITSGSPKNLVEGTPNIVISKALVKRFFNDRNPVGETIKDLPSYSNEPNEYLITGIFKDIPKNTHLKGQVILLRKPITEVFNKQQFSPALNYYVSLKKGIEKTKFETKFNDWYSNYTEAEYQSFIFGHF